MTKVHAAFSPGSCLLAQGSRHGLSVPFDHGPPLPHLLPPLSPLLSLCISLVTLKYFTGGRLKGAPS